MGLSLSILSVQLPGKPETDTDRLFPPDSFPAALRRHMVDSALTVEQVARTTRTKATTIADILEGYDESFDTVCRMCGRLGLEIRVSPSGSIHLTPCRCF